MQDWIKMRTDLYRDPKVCLMADYLLRPNGDLARYVNQNAQCNMVVTRNVIRCATVGATLSTWGVMRHRGKRNGDDLVCNGVTLAVIDDISDLPGFGEAMEACGWAVQSDEGIVFPRFFAEYNVQIDEKSKSSAAERQARYRANKKQKSNGNSDATRDVTSNDREEKRREEKNRNKETHSVSADTEILFENFWSSYPRKTGKGGARKVFLKAIKTHEPEKIIQAAKQFASTNKSDPEFTPHPATWLNQERWTDEPLEPPKKKYQPFAWQEEQERRLRDGEITQVQFNAIILAKMHERD